MKAIQAIRGMSDVIPPDTSVWQKVEQSLRDTFSLYGYTEIRFPIVEKTELFARSIGEETDIVSKEMYTFQDKNGDSLTLRPEGTASCVRACINNGLLHNQQQRLWYSGPMFRHERPQKGRYRQFHQFGAEAYGWPDPDIDAEMLLMCASIWKRLGISQPTLQINCLGSVQSRKEFVNTLVNYLEKYESDLDSDSQRRLKSNPMRILDTKDPTTRDILDNAPTIEEFLDDESVNHFEHVQRRLRENKQSYVVNQRLVRGLDYYNQTVFEWVSKNLGAQATVCAGGRYDTLVEQLGGKPVPAIGFAIGIERLIEIMAEHSAPEQEQLDIYLILAGKQALDHGVGLAEKIRAQGFRCTMQIGAVSVKSQMKKADKLNARVAVILGDQEIADGTVSLKPMMNDRPQITVKRDLTISTIQDMLSTV